MELIKATELATKLTEQNQSKPPAQRGRYSVEQLPEGGGYRVVLRDPQSYEDREVAR